MFMAGKENIPRNNGAVLNISQIIKAVMSSAAEAELGALFINAKNGSLDATNTRQTRPPPTAHPNANRQFNRERTTHEHDHAQGFEGHGHAIPLVALPQHPGPISILLETGHTKPS
jgi:hypothetical protein